MGPSPWLNSLALTLPGQRSLRFPLNSLPVSWAGQIPKYLLLGLSPYSCQSFMFDSNSRPDGDPSLSPRHTGLLVADFVGYKLRQKGYVCGAGPGEGPAADPLHQAMRAAGDEFETRLRRTFSIWQLSCM